MTIQNISWHYPNNDKNVIKDVSIEINKGKAIAFGIPEEKIDDALEGIK